MKKRRYCVTVGEWDNFREMHLCYEVDVLRVAKTALTNHDGFDISLEIFNTVSSPNKWTDIPLVSVFRSGEAKFNYIALDWYKLPDELYDFIINLPEVSE